jgi:hypothetical protein
MAIGVLQKTRKMPFFATISKITWPTFQSAPTFVMARVRRLGLMSPPWEPDRLQEEFRFSEMPR